MSASNPQRIEHIDSIRGIAALLVLVLHATEVFVNFPSVAEQGTLLRDLAFRLDFGKTGVMAFFAISGFVICPSLKGARRAGARRFLISRFFRLYPPFWTSIILFLLVRSLVTEDAVDWRQVLGNIPMLYSAFDVEPVIGLYWTLEVELVFYLLCLILFLCGWLDSPVRLFVVGVVLMAIYQGMVNRPEIRAIVNDAMNNNWLDLPRHLAIMFWGGLFRIWYEDRQRTCAIGGYQVPVVVLVTGLLALILLRPLVVVDLALYSGDGAAFSWAVPYISGICLFILGARYIRITHPFMVWLGTISYSIYLLHPVAIMVLKELVEMNPGTLGGMHLSGYIVASAAMTIILAGLVYICIEKPSIGLGRRLQRR